MIQPVRRGVSGGQVPFPANAVEHFRKDALKMNSIWKLDAGPTLLYVEDDADAVRVFEAAMELSRAAFRLAVAANLEEAVDYLGGKRPRPMAVLLDYALGKF